MCVNRIEAAQTACLMQGMADKLGVSVDALPPAQVGALVATCRCCTRSNDCILWMVDHSTGTGAAPDYCLNGEKLGVMRPESVA